METRQAIAIRSKVEAKADNRCEVCGRKTPLMIRTNQYFDFRRYIQTKRIEQRELSAVCSSCNNNMLIRSSQGEASAAPYCCIKTDGSIVEYR